MENMNSYRSSLLCISSKDRVTSSGNPNSDFQIAFQNANEVEELEQIALHSISLCNAFPNVYGHKLYIAYTLTGTEYIVELDFPEGFYNAATMGPAIEAVVAAAYQAPYPFDTTLTIDPATEKFSSFSPYRLLSLQEIRVWLNEPKQADTVNRMLGAPQTVGAPYVPVALNGVQEVFIHVSSLSDGHAIMSNGSQTSILGSISLHDASRGQYAYHQATDRDMSSVNYYGKRNVKSIHVSLRDAYGTVLPLAYNQPVSIICKVFYI
jgi:hypothetical protein